MEFNQKLIFCPQSRISYVRLCASAVRWRKGFNPKKNIFQWRSNPKIIMNIVEGILVTMMIDN